MEEMHATDFGRYATDDAYEDAWYAAKVVNPSGRKQPVDEQKQPLLNALRGYVNRQCRVTLVDGRVVLGSFICYDYLSNVLINNAEEQSAPDKNGDITTRSLGMILVKAKYLAKFQVESEMLQDGGRLIA
eukprot:Tamp_30827.p1 GENE.Tamp_30827~~Tamp_30827.p1  ORF type:complete len:140 (+),score=34.30 Tamp_30827:33-422(+)